MNVRMRELLILSQPLLLLHGIAAPTFWLLVEQIPKILKSSDSKSKIKSTSFFGITRV